MSDRAAREMTPSEWAERLAGKSVDEIAIALAAAESRGRRKGRSDLAQAVYHFEIAYRYAVNASRPGANAADLLTSAQTFASIGYEEKAKAGDL